MKVVLDTNIFLSGIHWSGASNKVLREWFRKQKKLNGEKMLFLKTYNKLD